MSYNQIDKTILPRYINNICIKYVAVKFISNIEIFSFD